MSTLPKNRVTTSAMARVARKVYREKLRPRVHSGAIDLRSATMAWRGNTPDFLIIGAQKAGTTALFDSLLRHPEVGRPFRKEVHFYDANSSGDLDVYRSHFWGSSDLIWGEATPEYLDTPGVASRVRNDFPSVKLIVTLRCPVRRAISHYYHAQDFLLESRPLERALDVASKDVAHAPLSRAYLRRSNYASSLQPWFENFPREQILVVIAERPAEAESQASEFLGLDPNRLAIHTGSGKSNVRKYPSPNPNLIDDVAAFLSPQSTDLKNLLGWASLPPEWLIE